MLSPCACMGDAGLILACIRSCSQMQINANKYKYMQLTIIKKREKVCTHINTRFMFVWDRYVKTMGIIFRSLICACMFLQDCFYALIQP